jgi:hypothetical protein
MERLDAVLVLYAGATASGRAVRLWVQARWSLGLLVGIQKNRILSLRVAVGGWRALKRRNWCVDNVHRLGFGSALTSAGLARIAFVFGSSH